MKKRYALGLVCVAAAFLVLSVLALFPLIQYLEEAKRNDAQVTLELTYKNIQEMFFGSENDAVALAKMAKSHLDDDSVHFEDYAEEVVQKEGVIYVYLVKGTTVVKTIPADPFSSETGHDLSRDSYVFTLAKVVQEPIVEGPLNVYKDRQGFLFIQPIVEEGKYWGEVIVAMDTDYVLKQMDLSFLQQSGYEYELWRVDSQNGAKDIVAQSDQEIDFSDAERLTFYLPTEWTLALLPKDGWVASDTALLLCAGSFLFMALLLTAVLCICKIHKQKKEKAAAYRKDAETGLFNRRGLTEELGKKAREGQNEYALFLFVMDEYTRLNFIMDEERKQTYLEHIIHRFNDYIYSPHMTARIGENSFIMAVFEPLSIKEAAELARGLSLELLWKTEINGRREYIHAGWRFILCPEDGTDPAGLITDVMQTYEAQQRNNS